MKKCRIQPAPTYFSVLSHKLRLGASLITLNRSFLQCNSKQTSIAQLVERRTRNQCGNVLWVRVQEGNAAKFLSQAYIPRGIKFPNFQLSQDENEE